MAKNKEVVPELVRLKDRARFELGRAEIKTPNERKLKIKLITTKMTIPSDLGLALPSNSAVNIQDYAAIGDSPFEINLVDYEPLSIGGNPKGLYLINSFAIQRHDEGWGFSQTDASLQVEVQDHSKRLEVIRLSRFVLDGLIIDEAEQHGRAAIDSLKVFLEKKLKAK